MQFRDRRKKPSSESSIREGERRPIKKSGDGDIKTFLLAGKNNLIPARRAQTFTAFGIAECPLNASNPRVFWYESKTSSLFYFGFGSCLRVVKKLLSQQKQRQIRRVRDRREKSLGASNNTVRRNWNFFPASLLVLSSQFNCFQRRFL